MKPLSYLGSKSPTRLIVVERDELTSKSYDSYPYVCVLMLSETDGMIGGETYIKKGNGEAQKVSAARSYQEEIN